MAKKKKTAEELEESTGTKKKKGKKTKIPRFAKLALVVVVAVAPIFLVIGLGALFLAGRALNRKNDKLREESIIRAAIERKNEIIARLEQKIAEMEAKENDIPNEINIDPEQQSQGEESTLGEGTETTMGEDPDLSVVPGTDLDDDITMGSEFDDMEDDVSLDSDLGMGEEFMPGTGGEEEEYDLDYDPDVAFNNEEVVDEEEEEDEATKESEAEEQEQEEEEEQSLNEEETASQQFADAEEEEENQSQDASTQNGEEDFEEDMSESQDGTELSEEESLEEDLSQTQGGDVFDENEEVEEEAIEVDETLSQSDTIETEGTEETEAVEEGIEIDETLSEADTLETEFTEDIDQENTEDLPMEGIYTIEEEIESEQETVVSQEDSIDEQLEAQEDAELAQEDAIDEQLEAQEEAELAQEDAIDEQLEAQEEVSLAQEDSKDEMLIDTFDNESQISNDATETTLSQQESMDSTPLVGEQFIDDTSSLDYSDTQFEDDTLSVANEESATQTEDLTNGAAVANTPEGMTIEVPDNFNDLDQGNNVNDDLSTTQGTDQGLTSGVAAEKDSGMDKSSSLTEDKSSPLRVVKDDTPQQEFSAANSIGSLTSATADETVSLSSTGTDNSQTMVAFQGSNLNANAFMTVQPTARALEYVERNGSELSRKRPASTKTENQRANKRPRI